MWTLELKTSAAEAVKHVSILISRTMRLQTILGASAVCITLASATAEAEDWRPITAKADLDYLVDSVHRIDNHVYLVVRGAMNTPQGAAHYEAPLELDCPKHALRMAWTDVSTASRPPVRTYDNTVGRYAPTQFRSVLSWFYGEALLQWACHLPNRPERLVNIARASDDKLIQIDSHSISRSGNVASFWTRYDYSEFQFDPPYNAPYDSKREFVIVNCTTNRFRISVGYDFTADGAVTDNMIARDEAETPVESSDDYEVAIKAFACGQPVDPETYAGIGGETLRKKMPLSENLDIDGVSAPTRVVASAREFSEILPVRSSFKSARIDETMKTGSRTSHIAVEIRPSANGVTRQREIYSPDFFVDRDMLGIVQLKSKMNSTASESRTVYVTQALTIKAKTWREGGEVSFVMQGINVPGQAKPQESGMTCRVRQRVDASLLNAELPGAAWPLECTRLNGDMFKGYYIEALGYFLTTRAESKDFGDSDTTVDSISIER